MTAAGRHIIHAATYSPVSCPAPQCGSITPCRDAREQFQCLRIAHGNGATLTPPEPTHCCCFLPHINPVSAFPRCISFLSALLNLRIITNCYHCCCNGTNIESYRSGGKAEHKARNQANTPALPDNPNRDSRLHNLHHNHHSRHNNCSDPHNASSNHHPNRRPSTSASEDDDG